MVQLCAPALIYLCISLVDIIYNSYLGLYHNLLVKTIVIISVAIVLNILCEKGFSEISWLIVLLAFSFISVIMLTEIGCDTYNMPTMNMPTMNVRSIISYNNMPPGTSDPQYKS